MKPLLDSSLMSEDSDDDVLLSLLANHADEDENFDFTNKPVSEQKPSSQLQQKNKTLDFNFLDHETLDDSPKKQKDDSKKPASLVSPPDNEDSSDEEDKKYFEKQNLTDYGRDIKRILKKEEFDSPKFNLDNLSKSSSDTLRTTGPSTSFKQRVAQFQDKVKSSTPPISKDVYSDPFFGLRIYKPLVSHAELKEKMQGRTAVPVSRLKNHLKQLQNDSSGQDWVVAGVIMHKNPTKTSQKGHQYCVWKITDLTMDMKTFGLFLFGNAYKALWKTNANTVIGILNPSVLENKDDKDEGTLSIDNPQRVMILGQTKDLGKCKSIKKNGEPCSMPVNLKLGEFCVYHVKQEYGKFAKRKELQSAAPPRFGLPKAMEKPNSWSTNNFTGVRAKVDEKQVKKDNEILALLRGEQTLAKKEPKVVGPQAFGVELVSKQAQKDAERLKKLGIQPESIQTKPSFGFSPKLASGVSGNIIDLNEDFSKDQKKRAKLLALQYVKKKGGFEKTDPNRIRPIKSESAEKGLKRKREEEKKEKVEEVTEKKVAFKSRFLEMLQTKSAHSDLIEKRADEEQEKYFNKLEIKEKMEEKMLSTFQMDCKAVQCSICKYKAFSSSELCKKLQHPIKVVNAVKRFYKCGDCGNRTITLDRIPTETCKRCASSKWIKSAMMDEKRTEINTQKLSIRGGEEMFIGTTTGDANLNLCVPDNA